MNIAEVREKYPQYQDLSDLQLADALHAKYYSDIPKPEFYSKVGVGTSRDELFRSDPTQLIPGAEQRLSPTPKQPTSLMEDIVGAGETALTLGTGAVAGLPAMLGGTLYGIGQEIAAGQPGSAMPEQAAMKAMQTATYAPRGIAGQRQVGAIGEVAQHLPPILGIPGEIGALMTGMKPAVPMASKVTGPAQIAAAKLSRYQRPSKRKMAQEIEAGSQAPETAKYMIKEPGTETAPPTLQKDVVATKSLRQGWADEIVTMIKQEASPIDKMGMEKMLDLHEMGKQKGAMWASTNRATDVVGDVFMQRVKAIQSANKHSGKEIDRIARTLKGQPINIDAPVRKFAEWMKEKGITLMDDGEGGFIPNFKKSQLAPGDRAPVKEVLRQMSLQGPDIDAFAAHSMKRIISDNVTFGKKKTGMSGTGEAALKELRHGLKEALDTTYPDYGKANLVYHETIEALDSIQGIIGQHTNLSGGYANAALGRTLRRTMGNLASRERLRASVDLIEGAAAKHAGFDLKRIPGPNLGRSNLQALSLFADEMERMFGVGPGGRTSFAGKIEQSIGRGAQAVGSPKMGALNLGANLVGKAAKKAMGLNDADAIKTMRKLLKK